MSVIIFAGPFLPPATRPAVPGTIWRGPARKGDVQRVAEEQPDAIGLIYGYFEVVPSVWHEEILWAMDRGIRVYGAASTGALRVAELDLYLMPPLISVERCTEKKNREIGSGFLKRLEIASLAFE